MSGLFLFIFRIRVFLLFMVLEAIALTFIVRNNNYQGVVFLNSSNEVSGRIMDITSTVNDYFYLGQVNADLAAENAKLSAKLLALQTQNQALGLDTIRNKSLEQFKYKVARVVNNSVNRVNNYLTINKGLEDGILPGMGVVAGNGVVGKVKNCTEHYSTVTSILHSNLLVSAGIKRCNAFGTITWQGNNPYLVSLKYIPRHLKPVVGDTIVTSDYSTVFPSGLPIGKIKRHEFLTSPT